jgi:hypothetical protein
VSRSKVEKLISNLRVLLAVSVDASASKSEEVKRLPAGKVKKKGWVPNTVLRIHLTIGS